MANQYVVQFPVHGPEFLQHRQLENLQANFFHIPGQVELPQGVMERLADQGRPQRIMVAGAIGHLQVIQAQFQLQQVTAIAGVGPGHHHPYRQPFLEFVLVDYRQRRAGRALGFRLQG